MSNLQLGLALAFVTGLAWSILGICIKYAYAFIDAATLSWVRFFISSICLAVYFFVNSREELHNVRKLPWTILLAGLGLALNYLGFAQGVIDANASTATVVGQAGPFFLALVSIFILKEKINRQQIIGLVVASIGFSLFYSDQLSAQNASTDFNRGLLWILFGAITWTVWGYFHKKISQNNIHTQIINMAVYAIASITLLPVANFSQLNSLNWQQWLFVLFLAANTLLAYGALGVAIKKAPVYMVSMVISLYPLMTIALIQTLDYFKVSPNPSEPISFQGIIGAGFVICGVVFVAKKS